MTRKWNVSSYLNLQSSNMLQQAATLIPSIHSLSPILPYLSTYHTVKVQQNQHRLFAIQPESCTIICGIAGKTTGNLKRQESRVEVCSSKKRHAKRSATQTALTKWRRHCEATTTSPLLNSRFRNSTISIFRDTVSWHILTVLIKEHLSTTGNQTQEYQDAPVHQITELSPARRATIKR